jgi:hypothetical protein
MIYLGIDPGASGGIAAVEISLYVEDRPDEIRCLSLGNATEADIRNWLSSHSLELQASYAVIERVSSSPQMGVVSAFTFGRSYGFLRGCLSALKIPFVEVAPQKWQKPFGIGKSDSQAEHKRKLKAKAQQLYPNEKVTLWNADALLLATYCRQNKDQLF